jgi:hypothetical protein
LVIDLIEIDHGDVFFSGCDQSRRSGAEAVMVRRGAERYYAFGSGPTERADSAIGPRAQSRSLFKPRLCLYHR